MKKRRYRNTAIFMLLLLPSLAFAEFQLEGTLTGELSTDDPALGSWKYTLHLVWDTGTVYGLSHVNMIVDDLGLCDCSTVMNALDWVEPSGYLSGDPEGCSLDVMTDLSCNGDPSLALDGIFLKFEPYEIEGCEAGVSGEMTVVFYSFYPPYPIDAPNMALVDKYGQLSGWGNVSGVFPGIPCDSVAADPESWGTIKSLYR